MIWSELRGHQRQVELVRRAAQRGRLAHAYMFVGPEGIGKRLFAQLLAQCVFCQRTLDGDLEACGECPGCRQVRAGTHPDLLTVACPEGKRELPIELIAGSDDRRGREGLNHDLAMRPMSASRRIAIIDDAQTMNAASANALLKTLEEPPPGSVLMLITPAQDLLLPTIRSRCQPLTFSRLATSDIADLLVTLDWEPNHTAASEIAVLSDGSLQTARQLIEPELRTLRETVISQLSQSPIKPRSLSGALTAALDELGGDTSTQRQHAGWVIRFAIEYLRGMLRAASGQPQGAPAAAQQAASRIAADDLESLDRLVAQINRCFESERQLGQYVSVPLCLEGLVDELSRIERGAVVV